MNSREPMLEMFIFETFEMIEQLQQLIINSEKTKKIESIDINEIFRIMHTIKGSSGMMMFDNISHLSHTIEDLFYFIRESKPEKIDYSSLTDLVLEGSDLIKEETEKIDNDKEVDGDFTVFIKKANDFLCSLKEINGELNNVSETKSKKVQKESQKYYLSNNKSGEKLNLFSVILFFEENCEMENIRCFTIIHKLKEIAEILYSYPEDIIENNDTSEIIKDKGFKILFKTAYSKEYINELFMQTIFLRKVEYEQIDNESEFSKKIKNKDERNIEIKLNNEKNIGKNIPQTNHKKSLISVDVNKLDKLMDLVGELVISEAMVTKNTELKGLSLDSFDKAARQHRKRLSDLQDIVMSIRMVSLAPTLNKMNRLVRDMCKKLNKEAELEIIGQDTEVDKNIIEHIGDPLMHIVRNSMDHGIESVEERINFGKSPKGKIIIEAKNTGGEVWIIIKDDGKGLDKDKILQKAIKQGLIKVEESEMKNKDVYSLIFLPGFSTNDNVTEYSGRGVGMDVVIKEIEKIRGSITIDSIPNKGSTISIKIPLTLAIVYGMTVKVGKSAFTIPVTSIRQSFIVKKEDIINDLDKNEMVLIRGECFSILRLHEFYNIKTDVVNIEDGIVIMVEDEGKTKCIFADALIGEQQVVIKSLPDYIKKVNGVSGCTLLGDGSISLILDISEIVNL
ncbi:chemotaxis protein CheA [Clostridium botulinum]|nr:chemotaxis protein CheA [Clostridium sporogenes]MCW6080172.1 chemotaxis protein CheA [Clostridium sporogenes]